MHESVLAGLLVLAADTPVFNSTAQIYQIILQFLIFIVNLFSLLALSYLVIGNGALDRMHEIREAKKKEREAARRRAAKK